MQNQTESQNLYEGLMRKALALLSKRRYTVSGIKKKLRLFRVRNRIFNSKTSSRPKRARLAAGESEAENIAQLASQGQASVSENKNSVSKETIEQEIQKVINRLKELNYLNDSSYAKDFITDRVQFRPRGKFLIKKELKNKGIHPELAEKIIDETYEDEEEPALQAIKSRIKRLQNEPPQKQKEKLMRFLASRGFKIDTIYKVIHTWYSGHEID